LLRNLNPRGRILGPRPMSETILATWKPIDLPERYDKAKTAVRTESWRFSNVF
jgi:hypothetical protein